MSEHVHVWEYSFDTKYYFVYKCMDESCNIVFYKTNVDLWEFPEDMSKGFLLDKITGDSIDV